MKFPCKSLRTAFKTNHNYIILAPINGHWGKWSEWTSCDVTCGQGTKTRTRKCDDPPARNGGIECVGPDSNEAFCLMPNCSLGEFF